MNYEKYRIFQSTYTERFSLYLEKYPYAMKVLDLCARQELRGLFPVYAQTYQPKTRFSVSGYFYRMLVLAISYAPSPFRRSKIVFTLGDSFPLAKSVVDEMSLHQVSSRAKPSDGKHVLRLSLFISELARLRLRYLCASRFFRCFFRSLFKSGLQNILENETLMSRFEAAVRREVKITKRLLQFFNVAHIITSSDQDCLAVLGIAATSLGVRHTVVAHGFISDQDLVSIVPIHATNLMVWTLDEYVALRRDLPLEQSRKVVYLGYPKSFGLLWREENLQRSSVIFVLTTIKERLKDPEVFENILRVRDQISRTGLECLVRFHPKERADPDLSQVFSQIGFGFSTECDRDAMSDARTFIGFPSSLLVQARMAGVPTFQLAEFSPRPYPEIEVVPVADIARRIGEISMNSDAVQPSSTADSFFEERFREYLT